MVALPFRRILVATDLSPTAHRAADAAAALAVRWGSELVLLHTCSASHDLYHLDWESGSLKEAEAAAQALGRARLFREAERLRALGLRVTEVVSRRHNPAHDILHALQATGADLLVVGAIGWTCRSPGRLGHVAQDVVAQSERPVLVVPAGPSHGAPRILVPTTLSASSASALAVALHLADSLGAPVEVLHVAEGEGPGVERRVEAPADTAAYDLLSVEVHVARGEPTTEIVRRARSDGVSLLVMAASDGSAGLGETTRQVLALAPCPVLVLPAGSLRGGPREDGGRARSGAHAFRCRPSHGERAAPRAGADR